MLTCALVRACALSPKLVEKVGKKTVHFLLSRWSKITNFVVFVVSNDADAAFNAIDCDNGNVWWVNAIDNRGQLVGLPINELRNGISSLLRRETRTPIAAYWATVQLAIQAFGTDYNISLRPGTQFVKLFQTVSLLFVRSFFFFFLDSFSHRSSLTQMQQQALQNTELLNLLTEDVVAAHAIVADVVCVDAERRAQAKRRFALYRANVHNAEQTTPFTITHDVLNRAVVVDLSPILENAMRTSPLRMFLRVAASTTIDSMTDLADRRRRTNESNQLKSRKEEATNNTSNITFTTNS